MRKRGQQVFASSLILLISFFSLEVPKRAFRMYEKGDIEKTIEALDKSLEKDTLNPAANYLYSVLHIDTAYSDYDVDEAYDFVVKAIRQFKTVIDPKDLEDLKEVLVDSVHLEVQKDKVDALKFEMVRQIHTIDEYEAFIAKHNDALQIPKAIEGIQSIAFLGAQAIDTWQSYKEFIDEFPDAEQFNEADSLYKLLIYEERTADGKLDSYKSFLEEFPGTPYRDQIIPEIFKISTATNRIEDYEAFLKEYPSEEFQQIAYKRIYHIFKEKYGSEDFLKYFPSLEWADSISNVQTLEKDFWIPKLTDNTIEFVNSNGESKLKTQLTTVPQNCLCEPTITDFVVGSYFEESAIISRDGHLLYNGAFENARDAGYGFVVLETEQGEKLYHKSGEMIVSEPKESINLLNESFIRTFDNGFYGLQSIHGLPFLENEYVLIDTLGQFIWLEKEDGIALISPEILYPALDGETVPIEFAYDEAEVLENGRIWVSRNGQEAILDQQLRSVIPFGPYEIYEEAYGWRLKEKNGFRVLHDRYPELSSKTYPQVKSNQQWLAVKDAQKWSLYDQLGPTPVQHEIDSLAFLGENMVMLQSGDNLLAQFKTGKQLTMEKDWKYQLLVPQEYIKTGEPAIHDYFMLSNAKNYRKIYNEYGREILTATFNEVIAMGPNMLRLQKRNAALADSTGHYLLNFVYDGIGSNVDGYVSTLDKGKFGVINPAKQINIAPEYEKLLEAYTDTVLVAVKEKYKGFINTKNKALTAFEFDEVEYFNDSIALVRIDNEWLLENIKNEDILYERITDYQIIDVGEEDKTLFISTETGQGIFSESMGQIIEPTYTHIRVLGTSKDPIYFAVKLVAEANIYVVIYYDKKGNKLFTQSFRQDEYFKIACPAN
ncbi:MAG: WG repeat-containing protein [Cytophagia bacterium]|nr:WG repeat-containing protein [Cytophagia bacterium]